MLGPELQSTWQVPLNLGSIDFLHALVLLRRSPVGSGGKGHTAGVKTHAETTAEGLQMDSFCADSTHPVILHALPNSDAHTAAAKQSHGTSFAISLQAWRSFVTNVLTACVIGIM